uniref:HTH myb-type domain-containing protein n=1 Tax=Leersia perrieri TaxID=77586 RepID=A0A0D9WQ41_9ORYZ
MDPMFCGMEWTDVEKEEARSIITKLSNDFDVVGTGNGNRDTRHDRIVSELAAWFPWMTRKQVIDLYIDIVADMSQQALVQPQDAGSTVHPTFEPIKDNFSMLPGEYASMNNFDFGMNKNNYYDGSGMVFGDAPIAEMVEQAPPTPVVNSGNEVNWGSGHQHAEPKGGKSRFWTIDEHRMFLWGLQHYRRGDWKNISRFFVPSKTAVQVSSHAQKFFRRLERADVKQRYSINDVGLNDAENPLDNNYSGWQAHAFAGGNVSVTAGRAAPPENTSSIPGMNNDVSHYGLLDPLDNNYGSWQALGFTGSHLNHVGGYGAGGHNIASLATSSAAAMKNVAQLWAPLLYKPLKKQQQQEQFTQMQVPLPQQEWNHQQMMGAAATPLMEGEAWWNAAPMEGGAMWNDQQMMGAAAVPMEEAFDNFAPFGGAANNFASASGSGSYQHERGTSNDFAAEPWMMNKNMF